MGKIKLSAGKYTLVDDEDMELLNQWKWSYFRSHEEGYAGRLQKVGSKRKLILMHRVLNNTPEGMVTDHVNQDKLDNRKSNLRAVSNSQNQRNVGVRKNNKLGVKGINLQYNKYRARIFVDGKSVFLGGYSSLKDAISARQEAELKLTRT